MRQYAIHNQVLRAYTESLKGWIFSNLWVWPYFEVPPYSAFSWKSTFRHKHKLSVLGLKLLQTSLFWQRAIRYHILRYSIIMTYASYNISPLHVCSTTQNTSKPLHQVTKHIKNVFKKNLLVPVIKEVCTVSSSMCQTLSGTKIQWIRHSQIFHELSLWHSNEQMPKKGNRPLVELTWWKAGVSSTA